MSHRFHRAAAGAATLAAAAALTVACGVPDAFFFDSSGVVYGSVDYGFSISEIEEWGQSARRAPNGDIELEGTARVEMRSGVHEVEAFAAVSTVKNGSRRFLATVDKTTGAEQVFHYDVDQNAVVVGDFDGGAFVFSNPDGSFDVVTSKFDAPASQDTYLHAEDGFEAWHILRDFNEFKASSKHALLLGFFMMQAPLYDARSMATCEVPNCPEGCGEPRADAPMICDSFPDFCTCLMCDLVNYEGSLCGPCE